MRDSDKHLRRQLHTLPEPDPPAALRDRIMASHRRRQRTIHGIAGASITTLLLVLVLPNLPFMPDTSSPQPDPALTATSGHKTNDRLRAIDQALQTAYERGASDDEVAPLWEARRALLAALSANQRPSS